MSALSRLLRERFSSSGLAAGVLLAFALSNAPQAQCSDEVVMKVLDDGSSGPILITPKGAPVIDGDFSFRVFDAPPMEMGFLVYSAFENAVFDPMLGATIYPTPPLFSKKFITNIQGKSGPLFNTAVVTDDLCGAFATFQAIVEDAGAPGGFVVTNAVRLRVGSVTQSPLAYDALATDGTEHPNGPLSIGDMDEDGVRDLVSVSSPGGSGNDTAWVRRGLAGGGFGAVQKTTLVPGASSHLVRYAELADFNGDGHLDLVRKTAGGLAFAFGNGAGGFLGEFSVAISSNLSRADVADLNNDGSLDIAAAHESFNKNVLVLLGTSPGFFSFPVSYAADVTPDLALGADVGSADLDEDGDLDLAVAMGLEFVGSNDERFQTSVLEGAGNGTFGSPVSYVDTSVVGGTGANRVASLALDDFDGDTFVDVAATFEVNRRLYLRRGNGDLTLDPVEEHIVGNEPRHIVLADVDDDAIVDLLTLNFGSADVSVLLGSGDGTFTSSAAFGVFLEPLGWAVDDVDLDGNQDLLATVSLNSGDQILQVAGNGDGTFAGAHRYLFGEDLVVIADFDGDGANDVITGSESPPGLVFHPYPFGTATTVSSLDVSDARAAHVNGDSFIDLVVRTSGPIKVLPGLGDGTFGPALDTPTTAPFSFALADFDGDQVLDIAVRNVGQSISVSLGNGDGTFATPVAHPITSASGTDFAVGDADGNATQDVAYEVSIAGQHSIMMRPGNGDGTLGPEEVLVADNSLFVVNPYLVDLGHDGDLDLVTKSSGILRYYANDGTGSFAWMQTLSTQMYGHELDFADVDGDGNTDVIGRSSSFVSLVLWEEPGVLGPPTEVVLGVQSIDIAAGDLDRDGMLDLAVADDFAGVGRLSIRYNQIGE